MLSRKQALILFTLVLCVTAHSAILYELIDLGLISTYNSIEPLSLSNGGYAVGIAWDFSSLAIPLAYKLDTSGTGDPWYGG